MEPKGRKVIVISNAVNDTFTRSEWTAIGYLTGTDSWIDRHPRLLRSLHWQDPDYKGHVIDAVRHILERSPENLKILTEYEPIVAWLEKHEPGFLEEMRSEISGIEVPHHVPEINTDAGLAALADAQELLRSRGPSSAVDRIHTGLHAFLVAVCDSVPIERKSEATANQLLKLILEHHPALADVGPRGEEVRRLIRTSASIVDAMGTLRNKTSLAHPSEELLGHDEAQFVIHLARSLLRYLDAKVSR